MAIRQTFARLCRETRIRLDIIGDWLPGGAEHMLAVARSGATPLAGAVAMIDPMSRRRDWLIRPRSGGRRSPAPYAGCADAASRLRA